MNTKNLLVNCLLALISIALSVLFLEQAYRTYLFGSASFSVEKMSSIQPLGVSGLIRPSNTPEIVYELKPNLSAYFKLTIFKTNSRGLRDKDYNISKSGEIFRVAVIGDSFSMPAGVEIEESYHSLLEEKLNHGKRKPAYEFINFAVGGYSLRQYLGVIKNKAQEYDPDLIIVGFCPKNDHIVPRNEVYQQRYKVKPAKNTFFHSYVLEAIKKHASKRNNNKRETTKPEIFSDSQIKYMFHYFSEISSFSKENNIPIIVTYLDYIYDEIKANEVERLVVDNGLYFLNASLAFKEADVSEYAIYQTDAHPNGRANRIFFEQLYDYLNKESLLERKQEQPNFNY